MDRSVDKNALAGQPQPGMVVLALLFALPTCALGLAVVASWPVMLATSICLASGVVYSVGPRLKRFPVLGTLLNVTNFAPLLWVGLASAEIPVGLTSLTAAFVGLLLQNQLIHEAADREEDARGRVVTTVRAFGERTAAALSALLGLAVTFAAADALLAVAFAFACVFVLGFPFVLAAKGADPLAMGRARHAHRLASLVAGGALFLAMQL
jgi:4-hydroxybenzoate polyprenyltransferase